MCFLANLKSKSEITEYKTAQQFYDARHFELAKLHLSCNFNPSHLEWLLSTGKVSGPATPEMFVKFCAEFGIREIRMGIHMDKAFFAGVGIEYYRPWLDAFAKVGIELCIAPGIKSPRWPEIHIAEDILRELYQGQLPGSDYVIGADDPLASYALKFQRKVYQSLSDLGYQNIRVIQPENEPLNRFGKHKWLIAEDVILAETDLAMEFFPKAEILLNASPVGLQIGRTDEILRGIRGRYPDLKTVLGVNYYLETPAGWLGELAIAWGELRGISKYQGQHRIEVTEMQFESWGKALKPGSDFPWTMYSFLKIAQVLEKAQGPINLSLWGLEQFFMQAPSVGKAEMVQLLKLINGVQSMN